MFSSRADSVTWNPHKLLCAPQQCSFLLIKDEKILTDAHATHATYLFQKDRFYNSAMYDTGDKYIQCGRRADVFKFWLMWKAKGNKGFEEHIDHIFDLAKFTVDEVNRREGFHLLLAEPECTNVSFWYVPPSLRHLEVGSEGFVEKIHKVSHRFISPTQKLLENIDSCSISLHGYIFISLFSLSGCTQNKGTDDEIGFNDGDIPTTANLSEFLQNRLSKLFSHT